MRRIAPAGAAVLAACVALASCTVRTSEKEILPWLKLRSTYTAFGSFGGSTQNEYLVRRYGFWFTLDPPPTSVIVFAPDLALASDSLRVEMVHRSRWKPVLLCEKYVDFTRPPRTTAVDCLYRTRWDDTMPGHTIEVRLHRVDPDGRTLSDRTIPLDGGRIFPPGLDIQYYDELGRPWVLILNVEAARDYRRMPRDCALATYGDAGARVVAGPPEMTDEECRSKAAWERILGAPLVDAHATIQAGRPGSADP